MLMDRQANGRSAGEAGNKKAFSVPDAPVIRREGESALTEDQVQLFESENVEMMKTYDSHLEEVCPLSPLTFFFERLFFVFSSHNSFLVRIDSKNSANAHADLDVAVPPLAILDATV